MKYFVAGALFLTLVSGASAQTVAKDSMDSTKWRMSVQRENWVKSVLMFWMYDYLTFKDDFFFSADLKKHGYSPASYSVARSGDSESWTATLIHPNGSKVVWEGVRSGDQMNGKLTLLKSDQTTLLTRAWKARRVAYR